MTTNFNHLCVDASVAAKRDVRIERLLSGNFPVFLFGANKFALSLAQYANPVAIVDDFLSCNSIEGLDVIRSSDLPRHCIVVNCVVGVRALTANRAIQKHVSENYIVSYFELLRSNKFDLPDVLEYARTFEYLAANSEVWTRLFDSLETQVCRETLLKLTRFYHSGSLSELEGFTDRQGEQYFDIFAKSTLNQGVFFDVGAFDGQTSLQYMDLDQNFQGIHIFEPVPDNMKVCELNLLDVDTVSFHQLAASNKGGQTHFSSNGTASTNDIAGDLEVNLASIDSLNLGKCTFLKLDTEGAELSVLQGARELIKANRPIVAVAVYHRASDYIELFAFLKNGLPDHKVYFRHYTEGSTETVMYFVPERIS